MDPSARHILAEIVQASPEKLDDLPVLESLMVEAALKTGAEVRDTVFHRFHPQGISGVVIISESHLAIHSYPEHGYASLDIFTCGDRVDPYAAVDYLVEAFQGEIADITEISRGQGKLVEQHQKSLSKGG